MSRHIDATKPKRGFFRRFRHRHHKTHKMTKKDIFQDDDSGLESPSKYEVKQAKTYDEEDILRDSAEATYLLVGSNEKDRLMSNGQSIISNDKLTCLNDSSTEESSTMESEENLPFMLQQQPV